MCHEMLCCLLLLIVSAACESRVQLDTSHIFFIVIKRICVTVFGNSVVFNIQISYCHGKRHAFAS